MFYILLIKESENKTDRYQFDKEFDNSYREDNSRQDILKLIFSYLSSEQFQIFRNIDKPCVEASNLSESSITSYVYMLLCIIFLVSWFLRINTVFWIVVALCIVLFIIIVYFTFNTKNDPITIHINIVCQNTANFYHQSLFYGIRVSSINVFGILFNQESLLHSAF